MRTGAVYLAPLRGDLRQHVYEALAVRALTTAGFSVDTDAFQASFPDYRFRRDGEGRDDRWADAYERIGAKRNSIEEADRFPDPVVEDIEKARALVTHWEGGLSSTKPALPRCRPHFGRGGCASTGFPSLGQDLLQGGEPSHDLATYAMKASVRISDGEL
jgi:hypothetical protein